MAVNIEHLAWQLRQFQENADRPAIIASDRTATYADLTLLYEQAVQTLADAGVEPGECVGVISDYSPAAVACLLALIKFKCILVPLSHASRDQHSEFFKIAELDRLVEISVHGKVQVQSLPHRQNHPLLAQLRATKESGLILFSSGSSGKPKAILHSLPNLLKKFRTPRHCYRTLSFLLFDHIGGFNTLFYTLANGGCVVVPNDRSVAAVCDAIERHRVELLPSTPSFFNLLLLADAPRSYDLSSLKLITYGTEVMSERTLAMVNAAFPHARFQQTYGLTELGILRSKSASNGSLMVKIGGEDYETKVVDGILFVRAKSSMLGYLNAPSPFDEEGWFDTNDMVIQDGEYYRILGRHSDLITVGGQKVYPAEVEEVISGIDGVVDVSVGGEEHLIMGQLVVATLQMEEPVSALKMRRIVTAHCKNRLQPFMIPMKVRVVTGPLLNYRFKKIRRLDGASHAATKE